MSTGLPVHDVRSLHRAGIPGRLRRNVRSRQWAALTTDPALTGLSVQQQTRGDRTTMRHTGPFSGRGLRYRRGFDPTMVIRGPMLEVNVGASTRGSTTGLAAVTLMTPYPVGVGCTFPKDMSTVYAEASDVGDGGGGSMLATANAVAR